MKKFITLISSIAFTGSIPVNTVGCKTKGAQILLVMDGKGAVNDKSFNQLTWEGIQNFGKDNKKKTDYVNPKDIGWDTESTRHEQYREYRKTYKKAFDDGAEIIVANGFYHSVSITDFALKNKNKPIVLTDSVLDDSNANNTKELTNVAPLLFRSEQASFLAGIIACAYLNKNQESFLLNKQIKKLAFGSFGGLNVSSVVNYMAGLHAAHHWWNQFLKDKALDVMKKIYPGYDEIKEPLQAVEDVTPQNENAFSGSFLEGKGGKEKAKLLIDNGADIIMPVAGIQTKDTLDYISKELQSRVVNVIGVDTDQKKIYNNHNIILSALKNLDKATYNALDVWYKKDNTEETKEWYHGGEPITKGLVSKSGEREDWVGVATDEISNEILNELIDTLSLNIQKVSDWWDKSYVRDNPWEIVVDKNNDIVFN